MGRMFLVALGLIAASPAFALTQQGYAYPPQPQPQQPQPYYPPQQQPQAQPPPPPPAQLPPAAPSGPPSTAGSQGTSSTAQPGSPGASSQQVVVNPPSSQQPSTATAPPSSTTVINPPGSYQQETYVEQQIRTNPIATVATDAAWGGLAGLVVGFGVTLVNQFDHWGRDLMVGAGAGVLVGAAVGVGQAAWDASHSHGQRVAYDDGMNRTEKDPVITAPTVGYAFRF